MLLLLSIQAWGAMQPLGLGSIEKELEHKIIQTVQKKMSGTVTENIHVKFKNANRMELISKKATQYELKLPRSGNLVGETIVPLIYFDNKNQEISQIELSVTVEIFGTIVRTKRNILKGEKITSEDVEVIYKSTQAEPRNHLEIQNQVLGSEATYALAKGTTLVPRMIKKLSLIKAGDIIYIIIKKEGLSIQIRAKAMESGGRGDRIRATTLLDTHKVLQGEVLDEQHIKISSDN